MAEAVSVGGHANGDGAVSSSGAEVTEKDPRKIARKYQLELCKKGMEENIIVYLGTGCGKTHIAALLIYELGHLIRKPSKNKCVFLAPTVALVQQQAKVIEKSIDFKVGTFHGGSNHLKTHKDWEKEIEQYEVLVMIPQVLLRCLSHCYIKMEAIALLIFDECHHAQIKSNHPYATIMKDFYKPDITRVPRIYGMTASPVVGKGASSEANLPKSINSLENILDAKVYTVEDKDELEKIVASPVVRVYPYDSAINSTSSVYRTHLNKLAEIKRECISTLSKETNDLPKVQNNKKLLRRLHDNILFCLENLGLWGALQASKMLLSGDQSIRHELIETEGNYIDDSLSRFVSQAAQVFASDIGTDGNIADLSHVEVLKEPLFSEKFLRLIGILSTSRAQPNMKCIIFVNRIVIARVLSYILQKLEFLASWNCHFLVGVNAGLKSMSRKTMKSILEKFRSGELNLLVATKVGEEGLDIQTCCLVIRFDLPDTVASFIQSRGRARMPQSEYAFLVNSGSQRELDLIERLKNEENRMNVEIAIRSSNEIFTAAEERMYKVATTGACISAGYSISLLHLYCSKLPHDEFFVPKPKYYFFDDLGGTVCNIILPSNAPIYQIIGTPQSSLEAAKKDACLKAIEELHKIGVLNDYLLPKQEDADEEESASSSDDSDSEGEGSGELHEMVVPAALKKKWNRSENPVQLKCYYICFIPIPKDRDYKKFGLFVKSPLPEEVQKMELDLHLARGRSVMTKLVPFGDAKFTNNEVMLAEHFQEMYFKIILERSEFISESVLLGKDDCSVSRSSTFYLLLPLIFQKDANRVSVDWTVIRRCLSSPIFGISARDLYGHSVPSDMHLQLNNGFWSRGDVESGLVYATHNKLFYFVTNILPEKNGYSPCKSSNSLSHMEHFMNVYNIHLKHPEQPLLKAKPLFNLHNLLCNRKQDDSELHELDEFFLELPPEVCAMKIVGFSKDIGSSLSLLPSFMHRLENLLVAVELKHIFSASFPEGAGISPERVLEALTTEKCQERLSLERLEILGDSFLKFAVGRHLFLSHENLDEGGLTQKRSNAVDNSNLLRLATTKNLQVYIRDQPFEPSQFFALGHRCPKICTKETARSIHYQCDGSESNKTKTIKVRCSEGHHWLLKKTIADVVEALVGAFIVDCGFSAATEFLKWIGIQVDIEASLVVHACMASKNYLPLAASIDVARLEELLEYQFLHRGLLLQGFVHPSYNRHGGGCYQRLEFLGDAVLDYLITSYLFSAYPKLKPGQLTDLRSVLVNNRAFAGVAVDRSLHKFLKCDSSNLSEAINNYVDHMKNSSSVMQQFEGPRCPKALGDLVESCFGAILLDTGFNLETVWRIMLSVLNPMMSFSSLEINPIRELTELCQFHGMLLEFPWIKKGAKFLVEAKVTKNENDRDICFAVTTMDVSKKEATRICAQKLLVNLKAAGYRSPMSTSLEEVLKSSSKMEPRLIGYDETPIDVSGSIQLENLKLTENFGNQSIPNTVFGSKETDTSSPSIFPLGKRFPLAVEDTTYNAASQMNTAPQMPGVELQKTARARLYEICAANCWKPPIFDSYQKQGQSHLKLFTSRVTVVIEDSQLRLWSVSVQRRQERKLQQSMQQKQHFGI